MLWPRMDAVSPIDSASASPAGDWSAGSLPAWMLNALATPARIEDRGTVVSAGPRVFAAWACQACRGPLSQILSRPVEMEPGGVPGGVVFSAELRGKEAGSPVLATLGLDLAAARVIADSLGVSLAGIRGAGALTAAEAGLVEFAMLEVLDRVLGTLESDPQTVLGRIRVGEEAALAVRKGRGAVIPMRIVAGGRAGGAVAVLHTTTEAMPPMGPTGPEAAPGSTLVSLALAPFALALDELASLAMGDVVLPGLDELSQAIGCRLVTPTLWRLCGAAITGDSPTHLSVMAGPMAIAPDFENEPTPEGHAAASIHLGETSITHDELRAWGAGRTLALGKTPGREAALIVGTRVIARGELVRAEGQLGLRISWLGTGVAV